MSRYVLGSTLVLLLAAACGDDGGSGSGADAAPGQDAGPQVGSITVEARKGGEPLANVLVYYHAPDGAYLGEVATDGDGQATIDDMPAGGAVTAVPAERTLATVLGVQPGDELHFVPRTLAEINPGTLGTVDLTMPSTPAAGDYTIHGDCGASGSGFAASSSQTVDISSFCEPGDEIDVLAYGLDGAGTRVNASAITGLTLGNSGTLASSTFPAAQGVGDVEIALPALDGADATLRLIPLRGGKGKETAFQLDEVLISTPINRTTQLAANFYSVLTTRVFIGHPSDENRLLSIGRWDAASFGPGGSQSIDLARTMPFLSSASMTNLARPSVEYEGEAALECGTLGSSHAVGISLAAVDPQVDLHRWSLLAPADPGSPIVFPELPASALLEDWPADDLTPSSMIVRALVHNVDDYDSARNSTVGADRYAEGNVRREAGHQSCQSRIDVSLD